MALRKEVVFLRLKELDVVIGQLAKYKEVRPVTVRSDLGQRWILERGLEAGSQLILEIADHILSGYFGYYAETYEDALVGLFENEVISEELYLQIKGIGRLRNILVHRYVEIEPNLVFENFHKALMVFPLFAEEVIIWLDREMKTG